MVAKFSHDQNSTSQNNYEKLEKEHEDKKRELKRSKDELRKANERNKTLLKDIADLNKKVSSVENIN